MARCDFATWRPVRNLTSPGPYLGGPFRIVHHTTEGSTAAGAFAAYQQRGIGPHFTIDARAIYQHLDTAVSASAGLNEAGGVQTNRLSAVQIEWVGFAGQPKNQTMLKKVAKLCRWLEKTHGIPQRWPAGAPRGGGPGPQHNRD